METVSFATAPRPCPQALSVAQTMLKKGYGFQNAARIAGMNEATLRGLIDAVKPRASTPVPWTPARLPPAEPIARTPAPEAVCCNETLAIIDRVAHRYDLTRADILGPATPRYIAMPRQEAMALVRKERPHLSYPAIGRIFGHRDHTTIMHGEATHNARMAWAEVLIACGNPEGQLDLFDFQAMKAAA